MGAPRRAPIRRHRRLDRAHSLTTRSRAAAQRASRWVRSGSDADEAAEPAG
jgi:hypothetical protein